MRIAMILGAGFSAAAGWPDTSRILERGAWLVTQGQAARFRRVWGCYDVWRRTNPHATGDTFLAAVRAGGVPGMDWPSVVEVLAGTIASVGATIAPLVSPRYALLRPNRFFARTQCAALRDLASSTAVSRVPRYVQLDHRSLSLVIGQSSRST